MELLALKTPAFLIHLSSLKNNAEKMLEKAQKHQLKLRPHVKTHKCVEISKLQNGGTLGPITVSTLAEAKYFAAAGFTDITYAVPIASAKLGEVREILERGVRLHLLIDNRSVAEEVANYAQNKFKISVFLKVDCGYHRAGVDPNSSSSLELAEFLGRHPHLEFLGLLAHAGHSYHAKSVEEVRKIAEEERTILLGLAKKIKALGIACKEISVGATPTCQHCENWQGITEMRPGNYIFFDKFQADVASCSLSDCAATVLTRVLSHYPERKQFLIDAGALALSKDLGADHLNCGHSYGAVKNYPELRLENISQEHGMISYREKEDYAGLKAGDLIEIIPNHSCLTAALFPVYHVIENGKVVAEWKPVRGW